MQLAPEILGAVKRAVDADSRPGRFILTGSYSADLATAGWPATGRVIRVPVWGLTANNATPEPKLNPDRKTLQRANPFAVAAIRFLLLTGWRGSSTDARLWV